MDARKAHDLRDRLGAFTAIQRARSWVAAPPSRGLHLALAAAWLGFLWTLGFFGSSSGEGSADPLSFADALALAFFLVILGGIVTVLAMAMANHPATAPVSTVAAIAIVLLAATCGFAGHPISAWGPDAALAAAIGASGVGIMARGGAER